MDMVIAYITNPGRQEARKIAQHLIEGRLIACANIFPIESIYPWEGEIQKEKEYVLIAKTSEHKFEEIKKTVEAIHPYDVPAILKIPVEGNSKYKNWIQGELG